jgi:hypothetical protein
LIARCERGEKKEKKTSQKYKKMTKYLYFISGLSQIWPNLPTHDSSLFLHLLWMIVTLAANKIPKKDTLSKAQKVVSTPMI